MQARSVTRWRSLPDTVRKALKPAQLSSEYASIINCEVQDESSRHFHARFKGITPVRRVSLSTAAAPKRSRKAAQPPEYLRRLRKFVDRDSNNVENVKSSRSVTNIDYNASSSFFNKAQIPLNRPVDIASQRQTVQLSDNIIPKEDLLQLEEDLVRQARNENDIQLTNLVIKKLIEDHKVRPNATHYEAAILANMDAAIGSAENVKCLLREMESENIPAGLPIYAAALKVLVVHPDLVLLDNILATFSRQWMNLTPDMHYSVIAVYIQSGQLELADEELKKLPGKFRTPQWLYALFLRALVQQQDWEAVMRLCYELYDPLLLAADYPHDLWGWVLDEAAKAGDQWVTAFVWKGWVDKMWIEPSHNTCLEVLKIAALAGLPDLAESVINVFEAHCNAPESSFRMTPQQESLLDQSYVSAGRVRPVERPHKRRGNMRWLFKDIPGYKNPRVDPWTALGPKTYGKSWAEVKHNEVRSLKEHERWVAFSRAGIEKKKKREEAESAADMVVDRSEWEGNRPKR